MELKSSYIINFIHGISRGGCSEYKFHEAVGVYCISVRHRLFYIYVGIYVNTK